MSKIGFFSRRARSNAPAPYCSHWNERSIFRARALTMSTLAAVPGRTRPWIDDVFCGDVAQPHTASMHSSRATAKRRETDIRFRRTNENEAFVKLRRVGVVS